MSASIGSTRYVQPIMVLRAGTHEDAVRAVALASVLAWVNTGGEDVLGAKSTAVTTSRTDGCGDQVPDLVADHWAAWMAGRFAKSVRRAKVGQFTTLAPLAAAVVEIGDAKAAAFAPTTYPDMLPALSKLQVSGTDFERTAWADSPDGSGPQVLINEGLNMSTGKTAAQAAHGLFAWFMRLDVQQRRAWVGQECPLSVTGMPTDRFATEAQRAQVLIRDAGFTEIEPGSATVSVLY